MLLGCVTNLKKMLFHVQNFVVACCFSVVSHKRWFRGRFFVFVLVLGFVLETQKRARSC